MTIKRPEAGWRKHVLYRTWSGMKYRCRNPSNSAFKHYGGRGIVVCEEWANSFPQFLKDMGPKPTPQHTLERKDNDGPYAPWNCVWATKTEQIHNRREKTHCKRGHPLSGPNARVYPSQPGSRVCVTCDRARNSERYFRLKQQLEGGGR